MEVKITPLGNRDLDKFMQLIRIFEVVFDLKNAQDPTPEYLDRLLHKENFMVFVALVDEEVAGGLTAYVLEQYHSPKPLAYIYDLAVTKTFQRQGIGSLLMDKFREHCTALGFEEIFVQADQADREAVAFYRSTQPAGEQPARHFYYTLEQ
ncbi:GNAT family N-acetyltransferase [Compostibacter hankyongensis]|uniref:N-acetyltransferase domain-containing protein n=1 Tax=Compostibacter hankyongensis TaxID=1007089 RepID=A0ABP8FEU2_9BACT